MTRVRPSQIWERRERPFRTVRVIERVAGKVTYQSTARHDDVVTISVATFKAIYRKRKRKVKP
jgi:hypothetical protein